MSVCVNDPAWSVETAQATGMCLTCPGCAAQAGKNAAGRWNLGFFCLGNGITVCNRVGSWDWPTIAHIRYNREVTLYCPMPEAELERIIHMAATAVHIGNGELYSRETTPPPIKPKDVMIIKKYQIREC